jgi:CheY-like chemotaxis protein
MARTTDFLTEQHLRALVLDDDAGAALDVRRSLEARGFLVSSAADGTRGLALLLDELLDLDVLVIDVDLPERGARSFADLIRRAGGERDLAIVALADASCASARPELLARGLDAVVSRSAGAAAAAEAAEAAIARRRHAVQPEVPSRWSSEDARWTLALPWGLQPA